MNIILTGFKSSGKSTVGKLLAELNGSIFVETDALMEALYHKKSRLTLSCREIYRLNGEKYFRDLETEVLRELKGLHNAVVSTGGGIVCREENKALLQKLGECVFLDVPLSVLKVRLARQNSPLFDKRSIDEVYEQRYDMYTSLGTRFSVDANNTPEQTARGIYNYLNQLWR
jgi:shikimate kinase